MRTDVFTAFFAGAFLVVFLAAVVFFAAVFFVGAFLAAGAASALAAAFTSSAGFVSTFTSVFLASAFAARRSEERPCRERV